MEPLPLGEISASPWAFSPAWFVLVALSVPALTWLGLAWRRAFEQDPTRLRRAGIRELQRLLRNVRRSRSSPNLQDLHGWCRATARAWNVRVSAPTAEHLSRAMHSISSDATLSATWRDLWRATEQGLYAADAEPPSDWLARASAAAASIEVPKRDRWFPNRLTDWLPSAHAGSEASKRGLWLASPLAKPLARWLPSANASAGAPKRQSGLQSAASVALIVVGVAAFVATGVTVAAQGEPGAARTQSAEAPSPALDALREAPSAAPDTQGTPPAGPDALREALPAARDALRRNWNDWAAHYNFAAAQAERGNWNVAAAHASAAFVQNPSSKVTREGLRAALEQTGAADPVLRRLVFGAVYQRFPALLSPAAWQRFALAASLLLAAGLTGLVMTIYTNARRSTDQHDSNRRRLTLTARAITAAGIASFAIACGAWSAYGPLSQPNAGMLYQTSNLSPTPTELVPQQETSPAAAGSVVLTEHNFLGWRQVRVNDKASGWIRNNAVMPLYESSRH